MRFYDQQRAFKTLKALGSVNTTGSELSFASSPQLLPLGS